MNKNISPINMFKSLLRDYFLTDYTKKSIERHFKVTYTIGSYRGDLTKNLLTINLLLKQTGVLYYSCSFIITKEGIKPLEYISSFRVQNEYVMLLFSFIKLLETDHEIENELSLIFKEQIELAYKEEKDRFFEYIDEQFNFEEEKEIQRDEDKVHIYVTLNVANNTYITANYQIGRNKRYNITNPNSFFQKFKDKAKHKYGKELTVIHVPEAFDERSRELINLFMHRGQVSSSGKYQYLNRNEVERVIEIYKGETIYLSFALDNDVYDSETSVSLDYINPKILIDKDYNLSVLGLENKEIILTKYLVDKKENRIDYISKDDSYNALVNAVLQFDYPNIEGRIDDFKYTYYLKYQDNIVVDNSIKDEFRFEGLRIDAYFDFENGQLSVDTHLFSGEIEIKESELNKYNKSQYKKYLSILSHFGFIDNIVTKEEYIWKFLNSSLDTLKSVANVYLSESILSKSISVFTPPQIKVGYEGSMLDVFIEDSRYDTEELLEILDGLKKKKKFILYKDQIIGIDSESANRFLENTKNFNLLDKKSKEKKNRVPLYYAFKAMSDSSGLSLNEYIYGVFNTIKNFKSNPLKIEKIEGKLRDYQVDGVKWLDILYKNNLSGVLADDMGLGKTIEIISFIKSEHIKGNNLIVAPKTLLFNWKNEFLKFAPKMNVKIIYGSVSEREKIINNINKEEEVTYITSYDSLRRDISLYKDITFDTVILDEAQYIKNAKAQKTESVNKLKANHRFALTGTPIENTILDLWSIFNFLMPNYLPELNEFIDKFESNKDYVESVKKYVAPFILRRNKKDVLKDLPEKFETVVSCDMTTEQRKVYDSQILLAKQLMNEGNGNLFDVLPLLMRLRQVCIDPSLFVENYHGGSGKIETLKSLIADRLNEGHRILIFSQFVMALNLVKEILNDLDVTYFMITGETKGEDRVRIATEFNSSKRYKVGLVSLKAGGTGLNLIGADVVIHLDPWWNVAVQDQATDRAHRIGQERNVEVIKLICEHSVEERVVELQNMKKDLIDKVISENDSSITSLTAEDINFILNI